MRFGRLLHVWVYYWKLATLSLQPEGGVSSTWGLTAPHRTRLASRLLSSDCLTAWSDSPTTLFKRYGRSFSKISRLYFCFIVCRMILNCVNPYVAYILHVESDSIKCISFPSIYLFALSYGPVPTLSIEVISLISSDRRAGGLPTNLGAVRGW